MSEQLLTRSEAQAILRVSKSTIFRLIHSGIIPAILVGNTYRIRQSDLDTFLSKHSTDNKGETDYDN